MVHTYLKQFRTLAAAQGIHRLSFYLEEEQGRRVSVYHGECDKYKIYDQTSLFIQGEYEGFCGSVFVEHFDEDGIEDQIAVLKETALAWQNPYLPCEYPSLEDTHEESGWLPLEELLTGLAAAEKAAYDLDSRVISVSHSGCHEKKKRVTLMDQDGHWVSDCWSSGQIHMGISAREGLEVQESLKFLSFDPSCGCPDLTAAATEAAGRAVSKLGAASYRTGPSPVLLDASVMIQLMDAFLPTFFAKNIQNHMSVLEGREGTSIAGSNIRLYEDPAYPGGLPRRFDDEGILCREKDLISGGCFTACLYNRSSAKAAGTRSGGNGFKKSFSDEVDTAYTNVILAPGEYSRDALLEQLGNGLYIDDVSGLHSGANPVSGDFSLIAKGYRVTNGQIGRGVTQVTVAGNFFGLLSQVQALGCRVESMSGPKGCVFSPDVLVRNLMISGNEA